MTDAASQSRGAALPAPVAAPSALPAGLDSRAVAILVICTVIWGGNVAAMKIALDGISPFLQSGLRSLGSGTLLFLWCLWRGIPLFKRDGTLAAGLAIGVVFGAEFFFFYWGLAYTTTSHAVVLINTAPFVVALGAHFLIAGDRLTTRKIVGMLAAFLGVCVTMSEGLFAPGEVSVLGDFIVFIGAVLWAATTLMVRTTSLATATAEKTLLYQLAVSAPLLLAASLLAGEAGITKTTVPVMVALAYTIVIVAFISYTVWFWFLRRYPPSKVASFTFLSPCFGVLFGHLLLGDRLSPYLGAGLALVAFGIWLINRPAKAV